LLGAGTARVVATSEQRRIIDNLMLKTAQVLLPENEVRQADCLTVMMGQGWGSHL
jgi:hypothetical protein